MRMYDVILHKRNGGKLSDEQIRFFVDGYTKGEIPDYQASALCMTIYFRGMDTEETVTLTKCMAESGDMLDLSRFGDLSVDKHSTGGVGDKTTLIVAPVVAALGGKVTKMSGRGLGHTGGTVDKLEAIPGYRTTLSEEEFLGQAERIGVAVIGQSGNLTPADKKLYALRDVTATVDSIPLITSSIMSKKLAAGSHNIVLDVKYGSGAFMKTPQDAEILAKNMVDIGKGCGRNVAAVLSSMETPLGSNVGNALEIKEAVNVLKGKQRDDLYEVCVTLAARMISLVRHIDVDEAETLVKGVIDDGSAFAKMKEWVAAQGGDAESLEDLELLPSASVIYPFPAPRDGFVTGTDAQRVGDAAMILGAGRASKEDVIDPSAGIVLLKKPGDAVKKGEVVARLHTCDVRRIPAAIAAMSEAVRYGDEKPVGTPLIYKIIT
ncbi:MAG: thymidine phosphorylase [Clostridia bacterium]|nr:thymidine phosphorylase [Clostridia bacterium]